MMVRLAVSVWTEVEKEGRGERGWQLLPGRIYYPSRD